MQSLIRSQYSNLFLLALLVYIAAAWFSDGFHHPDEHFQILEFSNYKLGNSPASDLPWEYGARIRPALQPSIAFLVIKIMALFGISNPFFIAFIFRFLTGLLSWFIISKLCLLLLPPTTGIKTGRIYILSCFLIWFVPYFIVRFSSETLAGNTLLYSIYLLLIHQNYNSRKGSLLIGVSGFLLGLSFFFRFQMGLAILGLGSWLIIIQRLQWNKLILLVVTGIVASIVCILIDHWFYNEWVLTPFNYFEVNILQDKASEWGVNPWWHYFSLFFSKAGPPLSLVLIVFLFTGILSQPKHVFTFVFLPFLIGHMLIGHKEMRFLVPVLIPFIFIVCQGGYYLSMRLKPLKIWNFLLILLIGINSLLLLFRIFSPASEPVKYFRFLYKQAADSKVNVITREKSIYQLADLETNFYTSENIRIYSFLTDEEIVKFIKQNKTVPAFYFGKESVPAFNMNDIELKRVYCYYPEWLLRFNVNNWQNRVRIRSIYKISP